MKSDEFDEKESKIERIFDQMAAGEKLTKPEKDTLKKELKRLYGNEKVKE